MKKTFVVFSDKPLKVVEPDTKAVIGETEDSDTAKDFSELVVKMYRMWTVLPENEPLVKLA